MRGQPDKSSHDRENPRLVERTRQWPPNRFGALAEQKECEQEPDTGACSREEQPEHGQLLPSRPCDRRLLRFVVFVRTSVIGDGSRDRHGRRFGDVIEVEMADDDHQYDQPTDAEFENGSTPRRLRRRKPSWAGHETPQALEPHRGPLPDRPDSRTVRMARLAGVEPAARGFEVGDRGLPEEPEASRSVTFRGVGASAPSPNVSPHPADHGPFAALVLQGFSGKLVSPRQAAALLGVNRETIYRLCARGELPHVRVGSVLRVDLAAYLARHRPS